MEWYLLKSSYADVEEDVNFEGMILLTKEDLEKGRKWCEEHPDFSADVDFGTSLIVNVTSADVLMEIQTAVKISNAERLIMDRYLYGDFGATTRFILLRDNCYYSRGKGDWK